MRKKIKKILSVSLMTILGLLTVVVGVRSWLDGRAQTRLGRAWASLERQGYLVSLRTLLPPVKNEEDNAARFWKAAEKLYFSDNDGRAALQRADKAFREGLSPAPADIAAVEALAAQNRLTLEAIREAAGKSVFRYDRLWGLDYDRPWVLHRPDVIALGRSGRLIRTAAAQAAESGRIEEALDLWTMETRLLLLMRRDLSLSGSEYLIGIMKAQIPILNRIVAGRTIAEKDLRTLLDLLRPESWREEFRHAVKYQTVYQSQLFWKLLEDPDEVPDLAARGLRRWLFLPVLKSAAAFVLENIDRDARLADRAPHEIENYLETIESRRNVRVPRSYGLCFPGGTNYVPDLIESSTLADVRFRFDNLSAWLSAARWGLAGRIHFLRHGAYPATPAELDKDILDRLPVDPYTGKDLIYKAGPGGFSIYSVGPNGRDEDGRSAGFRVVDDDCVWTEIRPSPRRPAGK